MLESYSGLKTRDTDRVAATLIGELGATFFDVPDGKETFSLSLHWSRQTDVTLVSSVCNVATDVKYSPATFVRQYFATSPAGRLRFSEGGRSSELSCSSAPVLVAADTSFRVQSTESLDLLVLRIDQEALNRKMFGLLGEPVADIRFDRQSEQDAAAQRDMKHAVVQFASDLDRWGPNVMSLARMDLEQALIVRFLLCNSHNFTDRLVAGDAAPSLSQLRNIESYIETHWNEPLDVEALASISNISARTLFRHFRKIRGVSPQNFIKAVRLKNARRLILEAAPNASVMAIALTCGFQSLGHFANEYRKAFGELPSQTLRRSDASDDSPETSKR